MGDLDRASDQGSSALVGKTARALPERPAISTAALAGQLSGEQLAAVVQVATPETDVAWAADSPGWTATSLLAAARSQRTVTRDEAVERDRLRKLGYRWDERRGGLRFWGWVPDADGAGVVAALEHGADKAGADENGQWDPYPQRCADVFVSALTARVPDDSEAARVGLMVHTPEASLHQDSSEPGAYLDTGETGVPIANETARRLACDAVRQTVLEDARGVPLKLGRRARTVPKYLFRLLKHRDRHCRAPGCTRTIGLHAHHLVHWADGGETDLDNLVLLCSRHHHLVHEDHWQICGRPNQPEGLQFEPPRPRRSSPTNHRPSTPAYANDSSSPAVDARRRPGSGLREQRVRDEREAGDVADVRVERGDVGEDLGHPGELGPQLRLALGDHGEVLERLADRREDARVT